MDGTIAAVATGMGAPAGINIIRISGEKAFSVVKKIFVFPSLDGETEPNRMYLGKINGINFSDKAFCVCYKAPKSYTGEDVAEIHCHGGRGVTAAILRLITENGARLAEPGEFTKRAFLNGKLTLSGAEGVADMINAETEGQVRNAYKTMSGELTQGLEAAEKALIKSAAMLEAKMDYPEELEEETAPEAKRIMETTYAEVLKLLDGAKRAKIIKDGADVAIIGIPNAGKSSLLNAILKEDRAIVTPIAGTTRDIVKESVEISGIKLNFLDTAGIRNGGEEIERIGIEKSKNTALSADVIVFLTDATVDENEEKEIEKLLDGRNFIRVLNKTDIKKYPKKGLQISAKNGENVDILLEEILKLVDREEIYQNGVVTNERHLCALRECGEHLKNALEFYDVVPSECTAVDLYAAADAIGRITGRSAGDEVIDEIFSRFCVGK